MTERTQMLAGLGLTLIGTITAIVGGFLVHTAEAPEVNEFGQAVYSGFPRGWIPALIAQSISLTGVLMVLGGLAVGIAIAMTSVQGQRLWAFIQGSRIEIRKVVWPTRQETTQTALAVFVFTLIMALFFWGLDSILLLITRTLVGSAG